MASDVVGMRALLEIGAIKKTLECQVDETPQGAARRMCRRAARAESKVAELEAIIAGRTTPPTDAEINAHAAAGGSWMTRGGWGAMRFAVHLSDPEYVRNWREGEMRSVLDEGAPRTSMRWWSLDAEGRLCAWPGTEEGVTPRPAAVRLTLRWPVGPREILAPGEPTRAKMTAQIVAATRRADDAETERRALAEAFAHDLRLAARAAGWDGTNATTGNVVAAIRAGALREALALARVEPGVPEGATQADFNAVECARRIADGIEKLMGGA